MDPLERLVAAAPIDSPLYTLEILGPRREGDRLLATFRIIRWQPDDARGRAVYDIREQDLSVDPHHAADPRYPAFLDGWRDAMAELLAALSLRPDFDFYAMPHELFDAAVLDLKRPKVAADFADALLSAKTRLGRWLPG